ncbi:hypothetical protein J6590_008353 [Homalodisca vitripennis]|nr:hypothetical protein J6590_008353 [Homalodisca vitripennis]
MFSSVVAFFDATFVASQALTATFKFSSPKLHCGKDSAEYHSTNFDFNSPFARFIRLGNQVASGCDLFFDGLHQVRRQAFSLLSVKD